MFRKLHPEKAGWNLSLVNLAVTNMSETAGDSKTASGRDIGTMFRRQEHVLKDFRVTEPDTGSTIESVIDTAQDGHDTIVSDDSDDQKKFDPHNAPRSPSEEGDWDDGVQDEDPRVCCEVCGMHVPSFAMGAHQRFHLQAG
jgi:DNA polymerase iota